MDINWQNKLVMKVNEWIRSNYFNQLIYDDDVEIDEVGPIVQFKSVLGVA